MESQYIKIRISPEVLSSDIVQETYSGNTFGVYSGMSEILSGGTFGQSLLTGLTIPIYMEQDTIDLGYYSTFDGDVLQIDVVNNFTLNVLGRGGDLLSQHRINIRNTSDLFASYNQLATYTVNWGDGSPNEPIPIEAQLFHQYPIDNKTYEVVINQVGPWGTITVRKKITLPAFDGNFPINPEGEVYFTPNIGSWTATPINYKYLFTGDTSTDKTKYLSEDYTTPYPYVVSGVTKSRIRELKTYGLVPFVTGKVIRKNSQDWGYITNLSGYDPSLNLFFSAYTIQGTNLIDYADGTTIFVTPSSGFTFDSYSNMGNGYADNVAPAIVKEELLLKISSQAEVQSNIFIERGKDSPYERVRRLGEVDSIGGLLRYGYGYFKLDEQ